MANRNPFLIICLFILLALFGAIFLLVGIGKADIGLIIWFKDENDIIRPLINVPIEIQAVTSIKNNLFVSKNLDVKKNVEICGDLHVKGNATFDDHT